MDNDGTRSLFDQDQRIAIKFPDLQKEILPEVVRFTLAGPNGRGFIRYHWINEENAADAIAGQVEHFRKLGIAFEWMVCQHDPFQGIKQYLEAAGFKPDLGPGDPGAVLSLDLNEASATLRGPIRADVRRIEEAGQLGDVIRVEEKVYGGSFGWIEGRLGAHLAFPGYLRIYAAYVEGEPACAGWTYYAPDNAWGSLWGGSTIPEQRRRGLYSAVLAARVQEAIRRGRRYLVVYASPQSRPILEKHGFKLLTYACSYEWQPTGVE